MSVKEETAVVASRCVVMILDAVVNYVQQMWRLAVSVKGQRFPGKKETMLRRRGKGALICSWVVPLLASFFSSPPSCPSFPPHSILPPFCPRPCFSFVLFVSHISRAQPVAGATPTMWAIGKFHKLRACRGLLFSLLSLLFCLTFFQRLPIFHSPLVSPFHSLSLLLFDNLCL